MTGYAPNPRAPDNDGYAPLTSSLLARKGEALPAVDAVAHEGVDIDLHPIKPANSPGAPKNISEETITSFRRPQQARPYKSPAANVSYLQDHPQSDAGGDAGGDDGYDNDDNDDDELGAAPVSDDVFDPSAFDDPETVDPAAAIASQPASWKIVTPKRDLRSRILHGDEPGRDRESGGKATVKFKMPAREFVQLRFAARQLELSCQAVIMEALECYLDANDILPVTEEEFRQEMRRLRTVMVRRRQEPLR